MTHNQLIDRLHKLVEKLESQARTSKDLARGTFDPEDPFCELRSADDPIWHRGCGTGLSSAARELSWLLGEFDPDRKVLDDHCGSIRSYARLYRCSLEESLRDYEGEGFLADAHGDLNRELLRQVRSALGLPAQREASA